MNNLIYVTGFSNDGIQNNFTTINYLESGILNPAFNPTGQVSNQAGIVITPFGESISSLGNGVPIEVTEDLSGVSPSIIEDLTYPPLPFEPYVYESSLKAFSVNNRILAGQSSPNAIVSVFINEVQAAVTTANRSGSWHVILPFLADGTYEVSLVAMNPLTGVSLASKLVSLSVNNEAPSVPVITSPTVKQRITSDMVQLEGTAEPDSLVTITIDDSEQVEAKTTQEGTWTAELAVPDGTHSVTAQAVNIAGSVSVSSEPVPFVVDVVNRVTPKITSPTPGATVANSTIYIKGTGQPNASIKVMVNDKSHLVKTTSQGTWSVPLVDPTGSYLVHAVHDGRSSEKLRFSVTHGKKAAPSLGSKDLISGISEPKSRIAVYVDKNYLGSTTADATGAWSYTPKSMPKGRHLIKLVETDSHGAVLRVLEQYSPLS